MWKRASENQRSSSSPEPGQEGSNSSEDPEELERKTRQFEQILQVPADERDRTQKIQVIDRAAAAIAAAKALLENRPTQLSSPSAEYSSDSKELKSESSVPEKPSDPGSLPDGNNFSFFVFCFFFGSGYETLPKTLHHAKISHNLTSESWL
jgi:hypothetical protein